MAEAAKTTAKKTAAKKASAKPARSTKSSKKREMYRPVTASGLDSIPSDVLNPAFAAPKE